MQDAEQMRLDLVARINKLEEVKEMLTHKIEQCRLRNIAREKLLNQIGVAENFETSIWIVSENDRLVAENEKQAEVISTLKTELEALNFLQIRNSNG